MDQQPSAPVSLEHMTPIAPNLPAPKPTGRDQPSNPPPPKRRRRLWIWILLLLLLGAGGYYFWSRKPPAAATGKNDGKKGQGAGGGAAPVDAAKAAKGNIGVYVTGLGAVTPIYTV